MKPSDLREYNFAEKMATECGWTLSTSGEDFVLKKGFVGKEKWRPLFATLREVVVYLRAYKEWVVEPIKKEANDQELENHYRAEIKTLGWSLEESSGGVMTITPSQELADALHISPSVRRVVTSLAAAASFASGVALARNAALMGKAKPAPLLKEHIAQAKKQLSEGSPESTRYACRDLVSAFELLKAEVDTLRASHEARISINDIKVSK
jgi:hypothetical protein